MSKGRRNGTGHSFNPRPPCGERPAGLRCQSKARRFNPRPPCGERRTARRRRPPEPSFQSTPSLRRATIPYDTYCVILLFQSTPSLRRATVPALDDIVQLNGFNPRPPCGERPKSPLLPWGLCTFQSTPSLRRATRPTSSPLPSRPVSIHALLAESDLILTEIYLLRTSFNPRPPCGERLPQRYMLLINHASGALRQLHEDGTSHTVFSSSYLVVNLRFPMSYKNRRLPGNLM